MCMDNRYSEVIMEKNNFINFDILREEGTGEAYFFYFSGIFFFIEIYTNIHYN